MMPISIATDHTAVGFEVFLPDMASALRSKSKKGNAVSDAEFKAIISQAFISAMSEMCEDARVYQVDIPLDLYANSYTYPITPPKGFITVSVVDIIDGAICTPRHGLHYDRTHVVLDQKRICITKNVPEALWVRVALKPSRISGACTFNAEFVELHYDAIRDLMFHHLYAMDQRRWHDLGKSDRKRREYRKSLAKIKRDHAGASGPIKLKGRALSDARHPYNTPS